MIKLLKRIIRAIDAWLPCYVIGGLVFFAIVLLGWSCPSALLVGVTLMGLIFAIVAVIIGLSILWNCVADWADKD